MLLQEALNILGVKDKGDTQEVKKAFRRKAREYHPDMGNDNADKFMKCKEAYEVLMSDKNRHITHHNIFEVGL